MRTRAVDCLSFLMASFLLVPMGGTVCIFLHEGSKSLQLVEERQVDIVFSVSQDCPFSLVLIVNSTNDKQPMAYCQLLPGPCLDREESQGDCHCLKSREFKVRVYGTGLCCGRKQTFEIAVTLHQRLVEKETVTIYEKYGDPELHNCPSGVVEGLNLTCLCQPSSSKLWTHRPVVTWTPGLVDNKLHLSDVRREQDGETYTCYQYWGGWNTGDIASVSYSLNVYYPPESPYFLNSNGGNLSLQASQPDTIFCQTKGGNPPVHVRSLSMVCEGVDNSADQPLLKDEAWTITLTFRPRFPAHNGTICMCSVTTVTPRGDRFVKETKVTVTVTKDVDDDSSSSVAVVVIAGGVTGGLVIIIIVIILVIVTVKRRRGRCKAPMNHTLARGYLTPIDGPPSSQDAGAPSNLNTAKRQTSADGYLDLIDEPPSSEDTKVSFNPHDAEPQKSSDVSLKPREGRPPSQDSQGYTCIGEIELATSDDGYLAPLGQRQDSSDSHHRLEVDSVGQRAEFSCVQLAATPPVPSFPPPQRNRQKHGDS